MIQDSGSHPLLLGSFRRALKGAVLHLWDVYSSPSPSGRDVPALLSLCLSLAAITGGLLYHWLSKTLKYSQGASVQVACVYAALLLLASSLCHPLRCVLTVTLPTVCTKQGRKLVVSASVMMVILNVIPNIALNVGAVARILKCTTEGFSRSLLNSSVPLNKAKQDLMEEVEKTQRLASTFLTTLADRTNVDVSGVKDRLRTMIGQIELDFSRTTHWLQDVLLLSNRVLAALYVALLVFEASRYLKSYLSSVRFGHSSIESGRPRPPVLPLRCRIRSHECPSFVISLLVVTFYFFIITVIVVTDHVVYHVVDLIMPWLLDFPSTSAIIDVRYKVRWRPRSAFFPLLPLLTRSLSSTAEKLHFSFVYFQLQHPGALKLPPSVHLDLRPRVFALQRRHIRAEPGGGRPAGMPLSDELLAGVPGGLC